jgi:hypothetical protein
LHTAFFKIKISSDLCPEISVIGHQNVRNWINFTYLHTFATDFYFLCCFQTFLDLHQKTSLTLPRFTEVLVSNQESEGVYLCIRVIDFTSFYNFSIGFWNCFVQQCGIFCFSFISTATILNFKL